MIPTMLHLRSTVMSTLVLVLLLMIKLCFGGYNLATSYSGESFFDNFNFPTSGAGYSQMLNQTDAQKLGLIRYNSSTKQVYIGVDHTTVIEPGYPGRPSVYLRSKTLYNSGLFIASIDHMPQGCGIQPQYWMEGAHWPSFGEIMMLTCTNTENVSSASIQGQNHECNYNSSCPDQYNFTGNMIQTNCGGSGYGCPILDDNINSCTTQFNANQGGYHAMEWVNNDNGGIKLWFWNKNSNDIPKDITSNSKTPDPSTFGEPFAAFKFGKCCDNGIVYNQTLTIDLQFCGYSASTFEKDGCVNITGYTDCEAFVANNPKKFESTYWLFDYINVYQQS